MQNVNEYWNDKHERAKAALKHTDEMENKYPNLIQMSIKNATIYNSIPTLFGDTVPDIVIEDVDSVTAVLKYTNKEKTAVLNFASFKNPGGMFIKGSKAQEECLCHESFLYNVLKEFESTYYAKNCTMKNRALYRNRALYTPGIMFERGKETKLCDVITCAAPNKAAAQKYCNVTDDENRKVLKERIEQVIAVANIQHVDTLILGAYGCGVFGQDPVEVATLFKEAISKPMGIKHIVFAIPDGKNRNLSGFKKVFEEC